MKKQIKNKLKWNKRFIITLSVIFLVNLIGLNFIGVKYKLPFNNSIFAGMSVIMLLAPLSVMMHDIGNSIEESGRKGGFILKCIVYVFVLFACIVSIISIFINA